MMEQKIDPPNLGFRTPAIKDFRNILAIFQKNQLDAGETGKLWNETKVVKKSKNFILKSFFLYDGAENRPPNLCFWTLAIKDFQIILAIFQKNQLDAVETGKFWNETKVVKKSKNFIFKSFFLYDGAENRPPQPMFLNSCYKGLPNYTCYFSKKSVGCRWNWKILKRDKSSKKIKEFYF